LPLAILAVAAVVGGWALAQNPLLLPGLTVEQAAAPDNVMVLLVVAILGGGLILFPSLALLFRLLLRGSFRDEPTVVRGAPHAGATGGLAPALTATRLAGACFVIGATLLVLGDSAWPHAAGVVALAGFIVLGLSALAGEDSRE
jgi:cytochrome d ubiquinol oxidase subunit II